MSDQDDSKEAIIFRLPPDPVDYHGEYWVQVQPGTDIHYVQKDIGEFGRIEGDTIHVYNGHARDYGKGFDFFFGKARFTWKYEKLRSVRDRKGNILWPYDHHK